MIGTESDTSKSKIKAAKENVGVRIAMDMTVCKQGGGQAGVASVLRAATVTMTF